MYKNNKYLKSLQFRDGRVSAVVVVIELVNKASVVWR
jgi:hypothetical protein